MIRISRQEAMSAHVDDLLKRQMSLRGEAGVRADRGRKWYYQNWFVFMVAGALAAVAAWAIIEPIFDDYYYVQGTIERVDRTAALPQGLGWNMEGLFSIRVKEMDIVLGPGTKEMLPDGSKRPLQPASLRPGQEVGVYLIIEQITDNYTALPMHLGVVVVPSPPREPPRKASLSVNEQQRRQMAGGLLLFPLVASFIGLGVGSIDGIVCRAYRRALLSGTLGLLIGFFGGFVTNIIANLIYTPLSGLAMKQAKPEFIVTVSSLSAVGFILQMAGRGISWALAGVAMGLAQGIALRSKRLLLYGFVGGIIGGLIGGLCFDPIDLLAGSEGTSGHWSRVIGLALIGACVGAMIGIVELLARDAWLRMTAGPLAGKEFLIFKDVMRIGSSPRSEIYLFNDDAVAQHHATIRAVGDRCELESVHEAYAVLLNGRPAKRARLRHGDQITLGRTSFVFQEQKG